MDWLADFVTYATSGETSERVAWWVGVATVAGVLRRKVWFDQLPAYQFSPNFYLLIVGSAGAKKSTSINYGMDLLKRVEGINTGPDSVTWQALIEYIASCRETVDMPGGSKFEMSCVTMAISEFGTFFDPTNRDLVDNLTDLWDNRLDTITKMTKTNGVDEMVNPWLNILSATTPGWLAANFNETLVRSGFAGRLILLHEPPAPPEKDNPYPKRRNPMVVGMAPKLVVGLERMSKYAGGVELAEEAYAWGEEWYKRAKVRERAMLAESLDTGFVIRKWAHLHKLAMVVSAARGDFPMVTVEHMREADQRLAELEVDAGRVFGFIGQSKVMAAAREIVDYLVKQGPMEKRRLYRERFFRTMVYGEFEEAVKSAIQAELVLEQDGVARPVLMARFGAKGEV